MRREDAPAVARIVAARLRSGREVDLDLVARRLVRSYFDHPWPDPEIRPWICETSTGQIIGFLGVTARPLRWGPRTLRAAIIGNLVVDEEHGGAGASHTIINEFLQGPQDLAISDHALDVTRKISDRFGGATIRLLSLDWDLQLRPATITLDRRIGRRFNRMAQGLAPVANAIDTLGRRFERGPWWVERNECEVRPLTMARLAELVSHLGGDSITPIYDAESLAWIMATPRGHGEGLRAREVLNERGHTLGCFVHYVDRDSEVLHLGAELGAGERVFECLVADAISANARALNGRICPPLMREMSAKGVRYQTNSWFILHTKRPEIVAAFHGGDTYFSRLDGERWSMRFVDIADE